MGTGWRCPVVSAATFPALARARPVALLESFVAALREGTTLAWAVEHAGDGDPLPAAWAVCVRPSVMLAVLAHVAPMEGSPHWIRAFRAWCRVERKHPGCTVTSGACLRCAVAIHGAVPVPPALASLLVDGRRGGAA